MSQNALVNQVERVSQRLHGPVKPLVLVEGEQYEGGALLVGAGADILVDGAERGDSRHGADGDGAKLLVSLEGDDHLVGIAFCVVPERESIPSGLVDHGDGGGPLGELHEVHGVDTELPTLAGAATGFDEVDHGRDVLGTMETCQESELGGEILALYGLMLVWSSSSCRFVDGHDDWGCDEGGK